MTVYDLHSHSTCSDGHLSPSDLVERAVEHGVDYLSITDHDTVEGYKLLGTVPGHIQMIAGIELSTQWEGRGVHILGLNIDLNSDAIAAATQFQCAARYERARKIGERLEKIGVPDAFSASLKLGGRTGIGRPHFAQHIINSGMARDFQDAFKKYLGDGRVGNVTQEWADLNQVIQWVREANGIPVLAHPLKYKLTRTKLLRLLDSFKAAGGLGMEVVSGRQLTFDTNEMAKLCVQEGLLASCGSDFHEPERPWAELGKYSPIPAKCTPVWDGFG